jgi:cob(I)alamin adenosyltransferase
MKIYTKQGDDGETGLVGGSRINKDDVRIEAYGTVDELCATIGIVRSSPLAAPIEPILAEIQRDLFTLGAELASPESTAATRIGTRHVGRLEEWIDRWDSELPSLRNFILPGGTPSAGFLHLARVICRRAERRVVSLARDAELSPEVIPYLNRLSDLLFVLARLENHGADVPDLIWTSDQDV